MGNRLKHSAVFVFFAALAVVFDQLTKAASAAALKGKDAFVLIPRVFALLYVENRGAAFGMLQGGQAFFAIVAVLIMAASFVIYLRAMQKISIRARLCAVCLILLCAGAAGNLIDRIKDGFVTDFLYFSLIDFPVFNVADIYVTVSCALLVWLLLTEKEEG